MSNVYKITLFTPTHNRAYILERLYESVKRQSFRDFEWLIVDDGSTDGTQALVQTWIREENDFPIRCVRVPNGGKCRAINRAAELAQGELFVTVDSDDTLTERALERIAWWEGTIAGKPGYMGVVGNRGTSADSTPNRPIGTPYLDTDAFARYQGERESWIDGERTGAWYTELLRKYPYPSFEGERFMTEAVVWNRMAKDGYKVRVFDEIVCICRYREDGLTRRSRELFLSNPRGTALFLRERAEFLKYSAKKKLMMWYSFYCEHRFEEERFRLSVRECAALIGAPLWTTGFFELIHRSLRLIRGGR